MNQLIMTVGLPRSGKTTWATGRGVPVVNPDSIRLALHGQPFIGEAEPMIWVMAKYMVESLFLAGHDIVILDATNNTELRRRKWDSKKWKTRYKVFDTDANTCIERAVKSGKEYLIDIIRMMDSEKEPLSKEEEKLIYRG